VTLRAFSPLPLIFPIGVVFVGDGVWCCAVLCCAQVCDQLPGESALYALVWVLDAAVDKKQLTVPHMRRMGEIMAEHIKVCLTGWRGGGDGDRAGERRGHGGGGGSASTTGDHGRTH